MNTTPSPPAVALPEWVALYHAINLMMCELGEVGEITTRSQLVNNVMNALHNVYVRQYNDALRAQPPALRDSGAMLVPVIPDSAMFDAGFDAASKQYSGEPLDDTVAKVNAIWKGMLAAAPKPKLGEGS